jgi:hypothetical protein
MAVLKDSSFPSSKKEDEGGFDSLSKELKDYKYPFGEKERYELLCIKPLMPKIC